MAKNLTPPSQATVSATEVAELLARELGGKAANWAIWLANDRKPGRVNRWLQQVPGPGRPRYNVGSVEALILEKKLALSQSNQATNRPGTNMSAKFTPHISALTLDAGADQACVLFVVPKPLASFSLTANEARNIARRLVAAADEIESSTNVSSPSRGV